MIVPLLRLAVSSALLVYASACDIATREVSDRVWLLGIPVCVLLDGVDLYLGRVNPLSLVASSRITRSSPWRERCDRAAR